MHCLAMGRFQIVDDPAPCLSAVSGTERDATFKQKASKRLHSNITPSVPSLEIDDEIDQIPEPPKKIVKLFNFFDRFLKAAGGKPSSWKARVPVSCQPTFFASICIIASSKSSKSK